MLQQAALGRSGICSWLVLKVTKVWYCTTRTYSIYMRIFIDSGRAVLCIDWREAELEKGQRDLDCDLSTY
ncbi:hypothetical protein MCOR16_011926, partial [Pyricularia oryzae]